MLLTGSRVDLLQEYSRQCPSPRALRTRSSHWWRNSSIGKSISMWLRSGPSAPSRNEHVAEIRGKVLCNAVDWVDDDDGTADDALLFDGVDDVCSGRRHLARDEADVNNLLVDGGQLTWLLSCAAVATTSPIRTATMLWSLQWQPTTSVAMRSVSPVQDGTSSVCSTLHLLDHVS